MAQSPRKDVVLVTGASSGIGEACCARLCATRRVYGASRSDLAPEQWGYIRMDVTEERSVRDAVDLIMAREGRIDALVHCAGSSLAGPIEETAHDEALGQFDCNYFGAIRVIRAVLPLMRQRACGKIIVIGSIGGLIGLPYLGHYSATKFALDGLIEALKHEVSSFGIHVTVVHPGEFNTRLGQNRFLRRTESLGLPYGIAFERALKAYTLAETNARSPDVVARKIEAILNLKRPRSKYLIGAPLELLGVFGKNLLPTQIFEYLFRAFYLP